MMISVPRMLRSAPLLRRGALLIRGPYAARGAAVGPGSAVHRQETLHRVRDTSFAVAQPERFCSKRFSAVVANTCMFASRSGLPVSSVIAVCSRPAIAMQLWPAASP
jgi:hypothetical protein